MLLMGYWPLPFALGLLWSKRVIRVPYSHHNILPYHQAKAAEQKDTGLKSLKIRVTKITPPTPETGSLYIARTHCVDYRDPFASEVVGLKVCTTMPCYKPFFLLHYWSWTFCHSNGKLAKNASTRDTIIKKCNDALCKSQAHCLAL